MIPENELLISKKKENLTELDMETLIENKDLFVKFLKKKQYSYQLDLCTGKYIGKETILYNRIETINDIIEDTEKRSKVLKEFRNKK